MRQTVSSNIRSACAALNGSSKRKQELYDIGCFAEEVAEVARRCNIPDSEVHYETIGQFRGRYRRSGSYMGQDNFSDFGPAYMKEAQHKHWYHVGQHYEHAAWCASAQNHISCQQGMLIRELQSVLQQRSTAASNCSHKRGPAGVPLLQQYSSERSNSSSDGMLLSSMASDSSASHSVRTAHDDMQTDSQENTPRYTVAELRRHFQF